MNKILSYIVAVALLLTAVSCAKKKVEVGRENPELEIQKCIKYSDKKQFKEAVECLEIFKSHFPKSQWGIEAEMMIGDNYFRQGEYLLAADSYQSFVKLHPVHPKVDYAYFKSGLSYLKLSPKAIDRDQDYLDDAIANFEIVLRNFPDTAYLSVTKANLKDARTRLARRSFYIGKFYYRTGEYIAAIPRFQEVVDKYSDTGLAEEALYFMTIANMKMNKLEAAKENFSRLSLDHPQSKYLPKLQEKLIKKAEKQQKAEAL